MLICKSSNDYDCLFNDDEQYDNEQYDDEQYDDNKENIYTDIYKEILFIKNKIITFILFYLIFSLIIFNIK